MQFLRALIFSAVLYTSASFAATIPRGPGEDLEITIKIHPVAEGGNVGFTKQLVFSTIDSFLSAHIHVILCVYSLRTLSSLTDNRQSYCPEIPCGSDQDCPRVCGGCNSDIYRVCFTFCKCPGITNMLISKNYSALTSGVETSAYTSYPARAESY